MFGHFHYVPVLKWKRGEQRALGQIAPELRAKFTPLIEIDPLPIDIDTGEPTRSLEDHVQNATTALKTSWNSQSPVFIDCFQVADDNSANGIPGDLLTYEQLSGTSLRFVPMLGLRRSRAERLHALRFAENGVALRVTQDDLDDSLEQTIGDFLDLSAIGPENVDLIIDLESIYRMRPGLVRSTMIAILRGLPFQDQWRTVTVVGSSFPPSMGDLPTGHISVLERIEWDAWQRLYEHRERLPRMPAYGDYGVQHPVLPEAFDPRRMRISTNIRFTTPDQWYIAKGPSFTRYGGQPYQELARRLINSDAFIGPDHCAGCRELLEVAEGQSSGGNPEKWRRIGAVHHITVAIERMQALPGA